MASADLFLDPREMHKVLHGDRATARRVGTDRRGRPEGEIVDVLERANKTIVGRFYEERGIAFVVAENRRINQDLLVPPGRAGDREVGRRRSRRDRRAALAAARGDRARRRRARQLYRSGHGDRDRTAQARSSARILRSCASARPTRLPKEVRPADHKGRVDLTSLPLVTIDGETAKDFDDAVFCERKGDGFRLIVAIADVSHYVRDGDALDRDARERGTSVYFPRRVIPMLPEALSNELCSLKPAGRPPVHGMRHERHRGGRDLELQVLPGGDALARPPHLYAGLGLAFQPEERRPREAKALLPHLEDPLRALSRAQGRPRGARRDRLRHRRDAARVRRPRQDRPHRARRAQRRAQADRGMHARRERLHRGVPAAAQASGAVPRARGPDAGEAGGAARFPRELRPVLAGRRRSDRDRLREAAAPDQGPARLRAVADGAPALAAAGALPAGQRRALRAFLRGVCALHLADPPLSGPPRASRDQGGARRRRVQARRSVVGGARRRTARSPSGAPTMRRATSRIGSSATSCRTRSANRSAGRSAA